jgi:SPP1 family predicted phage head-tail adaptor
MIERYFEPGITIERYVEGTNELGDPTKSWSHHLDITGRIDALTGTEQVVAGAPSVVATHMLFCPIVDVTASDRVLYMGAVYEVKFIDNPMNFNRFLQVYLEVKE